MCLSLAPRVREEIREKVPKKEMRLAAPGLARDRAESRAVALKVSNRETNLREESLSLGLIGHSEPAKSWFVACPERLAISVSAWIDVGQTLLIFVIDKHKVEGWSLLAQASWGVRTTALWKPKMGAIRLTLKVAHVAIVWCLVM